MGSSLSVDVTSTLLTFFLIPVIASLFNVMYNMTGCNRLSEKAEKKFVELALIRYVESNSLQSTSEYSYLDYPMKGPFYCRRLEWRTHNPIFSHYLTTNPRYFGIEDSLLKDGVLCGRQWFAPGRVEDFMYFACNSNLFLAMFFSDLFCNASKSWRYGFIWFIEDSVSFFLFILINVLLTFADIKDPERVSLTFTFVLMPFKKAIKYIVLWSMRSRVIINEKYGSCYTCLLYCKDALLGLIYFLVAFWLYFAAAAMASIEINTSTGETKALDFQYLISYFILSETFYSLFFLFLFEWMRDARSLWDKGRRKYFEDDSVKAVSEECYSITIAEEEEDGSKRNCKVVHDESSSDGATMNVLHS